MSERRTARRHYLSLPLIIQLPDELQANLRHGKTRDISPRGLYFLTDREIEAEAELDITVALPTKITHRTDFLLRAQGKVIRVERRIEEGDAEIGVAAVIKRYDIVRGARVSQSG